MSANGSNYSIVYDSTAGNPAVIEERTSGGSVYYYREPNGELIARQAGSDWHYYHFDALGSTRLLTNGSRTVTDKYAYDAYGTLISHDKMTATSIDQPCQYVGQLGYCTHYQEPEFGLVQLGIRFYDGDVGRFTQRDSVESSTGSSFAYADGGPIAATDPSGLSPRQHPKCKSTNRYKPPTCGNGETAVFLTCFSGAGSGGTWGNGAVYCTHKQCGGCRNYSQPLCPKGTQLSIPGYGSVTIGTCGCGQTKNHPSPNNWIDLWMSGCKNLACWVCLKLPKTCNPGGKAQ